VIEMSLIKELIEELNSNKVCVSFNWIGESSRDTETWGLSIKMRTGNQNLIIIDINNFVTYITIHEKLHLIHPRKMEAEIKQMTGQIFKSLSLGTKQKLVRAIRDNAKRLCWEVSDEEKNL